MEESASINEFLFSLFGEIVDCFIEFWRNCSCWSKDTDVGEFNTYARYPGKISRLKILYTEL
jgi:hypothetical protein